MTRHNPNQAFDDSWIDHGLTAARKRKVNGKAASESGDGDAPARMQLRYLADIKARTSTRYIVKGVINAGEFSTLTGPSGCGKTHVATDIGFHVARGEYWRGHRVKQMGVVIVACEGGSGIEDRIAAIKDQIGVPGDLPLAVISDSIDLCHDDDDMRLLISRIDEAAEHFGMKVGLIIIDTWSRALAGGDENSPQDMGGTVRRCDVLRDKTGAHVLAIQHTGKDAAKGARGHSLLRAAVDTEIIVTRDDVTKVITCRVDKQRNGPSGAEVTVALEVVELGVDEDGDPITACLVIDSAGPTSKPSAVNLSAPCAIALTALRQAIAEAGEAPPASNHVPPGIKAVPSELWRKFAYARSISNEGVDAKRKAFKRASEQLQARGIVAGWQDWVWPT